MPKGNWKYTKDELDWIENNFTRDISTKKLCEDFNKIFPNHTITRTALSKIINKHFGVKQRPKTIKIPSKNKIGTIICDKDGKKCRVKTENGYVSANIYFKNLYNIPKNKMIIHLNGDYTDFEKEHIEAVDKNIYHALMWRGWIFKDIELTKTAILCAELISLLPEISHNENQFLNSKK